MLTLAQGDSSVCREGEAELYQGVKATRPERKHLHFKQKEKHGNIREELESL